jgi:hypothetical protein
MTSLISGCLTAAALLCAFAFDAAAGEGPLQALPEDLEVALALSAAPAHWRAGATVHVLDPASGYRIAREGDSGTACLVGRTNWRRGVYRDDLLAPMCFDAAGVDAILPVRLELEALRAQGLSAEALRDTIAANYESGKYRAPARAGYAPMLSPILIAHPANAPEPRLLNYPHLMFYAPGVTMEDIGGRRFADPVYPWVLAPGLHGFIIQAVGAAEKAAINAGHKSLTDALCEIRELWCLE